MSSQILWLVPMVLLAACGPDPGAGDAATAAASPKAQAKPAVARPQADPLATMARAVGNGKPGAAVDIRYDLTARPEVGKPIEVQIALVPGAGVEAMDVTFSGMEGITLSGALTATFAGVKTGEPYKHTLSVLPDRNGVFYITASVSAQMGGASSGRTFSIPFVVGTPAVQQKAAVAATDATGQPVEVMKAEETRR